MLDMRLFRRGSFSGAILVNLLSVVGLVGFLFFVAQHLQLIIGMSPMNAGIALLPGLVAMILAGLGVVPIARRVAPRIVVPIALTFSVAGYAVVAASTDPDSLWLLVGAFALVGIGIGAAETVSNELILTSAPPEKAGAASAVSETAYELGAVLGTAVLGGILTAIYRATIVIPEGVSRAVGDVARETLAGAIVAAEGLEEPAASALMDAAAHAFDAGVSVAAIIGAALIVVAAVIAAGSLGGRSTPTVRVKR